MKCYIPVFGEAGIFTENYKYIGDFETPRDAAVYVRSVLDLDPSEVGIFTLNECIWGDSDVLELEEKNEVLYC